MSDESGDVANRPPRDSAVTAPEKEGREGRCPECGEVLRKSVCLDGNWYCPGCDDYRTPATPSPAHERVCQDCGQRGFHVCPADLSPVVDRLRKRLKHDLKAIEATDEYPANEYLRGMHTGYRAALALLDKEARNG